MRAPGRIVTALAAAIGSAFAAYTYYFTDTFATINTSAWSVNGSVSGGASGLTSSTQGSLISSVAVPDGTSEYEVSATIKLGYIGSGAMGAYSLYLRATQDALTGWPLQQGSAYVVRIVSTTWAPACMAT